MTETATREKKSEGFLTQPIDKEYFEAGKPFAIICNDNPENDYTFKNANSMQATFRAKGVLYIVKETGYRYHCAVTSVLKNGFTFEMNLMCNQFAGFVPFDNCRKV